MAQAALWFGAQDGIYEHQRWLVKDQTCYDRHLYQQAIAAARATLGDEKFNAAWAEGRAMSLEQVIEKYNRINQPGVEIARI